MKYSERLEFEVTGMPSLQVKTLTVHESRPDRPERNAGVGPGPKRRDLYMEIPGVIVERRTGRRRLNAITVFLGTLEQRDGCWQPDEGLMAWMKRRGHVRNRGWRDLESLQWEVRRLARWDHLGATREALEAIRRTTGEG